LQSAGAATFFTIDAGPQLKAVCEPAEAEKVRDVLASVPGVEDVLVTGLGAGARLVDDD
jgi:diphosphomevalonate decarboxylase